MAAMQPLVKNVSVAVLLSTMDGEPIEVGRGDVPVYGELVDPASADPLLKLTFEKADLATLLRLAADLLDPPKPKRSWRTRMAIRKGLRQSARGDTHDMGSFAEYAKDVES